MNNLIIKIVCIIIFLARLSIQAADVTDPTSSEIARRYESGDTMKKMGFDVNGDGITDLFFSIAKANPDPTTKISNAQAGGVVTWDTYVSNPGTSTFKVCDNLEISGEIAQGVGLDLNPDQLYFGSIAEIGRVAIVTCITKRGAARNSIVIYAYSWESDHFKQWQLAEYAEGQTSGIFNKYLTESNRTHVTLQNVTP